MDSINNYLPWVEKYRPKYFENIISHQMIINSIKSMIDNGNMPHLLFYGPAGTGKTSTSNVICTYLFKDDKNAHVLELNASDDRNISTVRNEIQNFSTTDLIFSNGLKIVILDEADAMTTPAQMALRCIIETNSAHVRFCIICNNINSIIPAIQSRCSKFRFPPLGREIIYNYLHNIIKKESLSFDESGINSIVKISKGDLRKAINILQSTSLSLNKCKFINESNVHLTMGYPSEKNIKTFLNFFLNYDFKYSIQRITELKTNLGLSLADIITELTILILDYDFPYKIKCNILRSLGDLEYFLSKGTNESIHLASLVGIFQIARDDLANENY